MRRRSRGRRGGVVGTCKSEKSGTPAVPAMSGTPVGHTEPPVRLSVRPALACDAAPLGFFFDTFLRRDCFLRRGQLEEMLRGPRHRLFVAEIDGVLVGAAVLTRGSRLVNALVHPAYRGLGIGRALLEASEAREALVKRDMSTGDPRGFYAALGFESVGSGDGVGASELMRRPA